MDDNLNIRAKKSAYMLLRVRPRSESEIRQRLELKGYAAAVIDSVVWELTRLGQIDDEKFARFWIESRMHLNPVGDILLRRELKEKGVSDSITEAALSDSKKNYDEYDVAFNMAAFKFERLNKLDRKKAVKRLYDFLLRRGFTYDTVRKIIENLCGLTI